MSHTHGHTHVMLVLGAGIGGRGVALAAVANQSTNWHIVVVDRDADLAAGLAQAVRSAGGTAESASVDLTDLAAVEHFRDALLVRLGRVDAVIHLVGGWRGSTTVDADAIAAWAALLPGVVATVQTTSVAFREPLAEAASGRFVMVTSTAAAHPTQSNAAYASAKSAAAAWVRALGDSFRDTPASACIVAVKALVDPADRAANPHRKYPGYTDTTELGQRIVDLVSTRGLAPVTELDLTKAV